jgi:hypothetical protein
MPKGAAVTFDYPSFLGDVSLVGDASLLAIAGAVFKYWQEVRTENRRQRVEAYERLRKGFDEEKAFFTIFAALESHAIASTADEKAAAASALRKIDYRIRMRFAAFIENVALYAKSGVFSYELANYEFGDYTRKCWVADPFWEELCDAGKKNYQEPLWGMFKEFVGKIKICDDRLKQNPDYEIKRLRV